ncbi:MAG: PfkB family carbohydrate kinase, partial [Chloroflexota bacterium]|nr:PfkB family carbohydrate kinase [Chloroflexota bacterium]
MTTPSPAGAPGRQPEPGREGNALDYLVVGHVTKDITPDAPGGYVFGGTASFASLTIRNLGRRAGVLTRCAPLPELSAFLSGVALHCVPALETTTFENIYTGQERVQYVRAVAPPISADSVPAAWRSTPVLHLGPLVQEVPAEIADAFPASTLVGATPQGWTRAWDGDGRVRQVPWTNAEQALERIDVLIFSVEDMRGDADLIRRYAEMARLAVVTEGRRGCTVWREGRRERFPAFDVEEVDPTGAGDVFAAAFFLRYA